MGYVKAFLAPFLKDKMVWAAIVSWALTFANSKWDLGMDADAVQAAAGGVSAFAVARMAYVLNKKRKADKESKDSKKE